MDGEQALTYQVCARCGLVFQSPRMSKQELAAFYSRGYRTLVQGTEEITDKDLRIQAGRARHLVDVLKRNRISPQTHLDIGFTHTQEEVLQIQLGHLPQSREVDLGVAQRGVGSAMPEMIADLLQGKARS